MLLEQYNEQGLLSITSVLGATTTRDRYAFRGDLVLKEGELRDGSVRDRKPPELVIHQAVVLADNDKFLFASGLLYEVDKLSVFVDKYKAALTPETILILYVEDIAAKMKVIYEGLTVSLVPYSGGMIWNDLLEELYIEKGDMKGLSAEDKVMVAFEAAKDFDTKTELVSFDDALANTIEVVKELGVGPV